jgi:hypothetical protein
VAVVVLPRPSQGPGGWAVAGITLGSAALDRKALELPHTDTGDRLLAVANPASAKHDSSRAALLGLMAEGVQAAGGAQVNSIGQAELIAGSADQGPGQVLRKV